MIIVEKHWTDIGPQRFWVSTDWFKRCHFGYRFNQKSQSKINSRYTLIFCIWISIIFSGHRYTSSFQNVILIIWRNRFIKSISRKFYHFSDQNHRFAEKKIETCFWLLSNNPKTLEIEAKIQQNDFKSFFSPAALFYKCL